jgi:hypothetical protein
MAGKSGAIRAGRAFVELFADKSKLTRGLRSASADLKAWGSGVTAIGAKVAGIGAAITAPFLAFAKISADVGGELSDTAAKTGVSVEALSTLGYAAKLAGVDSTALAGGLNKMQKTLVAAAGGSKSAAKALGDVGLTVEGLAGLKPDEQFKAIAEGLSRVTDPAQRTALAMEIFGKSGADLLPMLAGGAAGLDAMQAEARRLGVEITAADAAAADKLGDTLDTLKTQFTAIAIRVSAAILPAVQRFATAVTELAVRSGVWIRENRALIQTVFAIGGGLVAAGAAISGFGFALSGVGTGLGIVVKLLPLMGAGFGLIGSTLGVLMTPLGAVTAAVVGLGSYLVYSSGAGGDALRWLGGEFSAVAGDATSAWAGIKAALGSGDLGAAAAVGLGFFKLEFLRATTWVSTAWEKFNAWINDGAADAWYLAVETMSNAWAGFESFYVTGTSYLKGVWETFSTWIGNTWDSLMGWLAEKYSQAVGAITGEDQTAGIEGIRRSTQDSIDQRNRDSSQAQASLSADQQTRLGAIENARAQRSRDNAAANADSRGANASARDAAIADAERGLQAAQKEFAATVGKAVATTNSSAAERPGLQAFDPKRAGFDPTTVATGIGAGVVDAKARTAGTFSGALAAQALGTGSVDQKIQENTKKAADTLDKIFTTVQAGGSFA